MRPKKSSGRLRLKRDPDLEHPFAELAAFLPADPSLQDSMRAILQRVSHASVSVHGQQISSIGPGILALIAVGTDDSLDQVPALASRILNLKLWNEGQKATSVALVSIAGQSTSSEGTSTEVAQAEKSSRKEEVWGGKPWKTSVVELEGDILCGEHATRADKATANSSEALLSCPHHQCPNSRSMLERSRERSLTFIDRREELKLGRSIMLS